MELSRTQFIAGVTGLLSALPAGLQGAMEDSRSRLRIRKVEPVLIKGPTRFARAVLARVYTDQGVSGVGECFAWHALDESKGLRLHRYISSVGDTIVGSSPLDINAFLLRFENNPPRNDDPSPLEWASALAAIEIALWDITGQVLGAPIYRLFGGAVRTRIPLYANHGIFASAKTSEERLERAIEAKAKGFKMFKWDPFRQRGNPEPSVIRQELREVALFRERFGSDFPLAIDAHARYETPAAIAAAKALEEFRPVFFEEPVGPANLDGYRQVAKATRIPIASGERLANMRETRELLETHTIQVLQLEPGNFSGLLQAFRGCAMAQSFGVQMAPHDWCMPVLTRATTHLCAAIPNLLRQEYPATAREDHWENDLLEPPTMIQDGELTLPDGPGLGSKLNEKLLASRRVDG